MTDRKKTVAESFDEWSIKNQVNGCLEWTRSLTPQGYGQLSVNGRPCLSHRFAWVKRFGSVPGDLHVLHRCDNRRCVNVDHLFLGTNLDNIRDMHSKGRGSGGGFAGESHPCSKLTLSQVDELRERYASGTISQRALAAIYGLAQTSIGAIVRGKTWGERARLPRAIHPVKARRETVVENLDKYWTLDESSGCWLWQLALNEDGFGHVKVKGRNISAHRFSYERHQQKVDVGLVVRHICGQRACVNPDHLRVGTQGDVIKEMVSQGRQRGARGTANALAKLSEVQVYEIRRRSFGGVSRAELSREYDVSASLISAIALGHVWKHLESAP